MSGIDALGCVAFTFAFAFMLVTVLIIRIHNTDKQNDLEFEKHLDQKDKDLKAKEVELNKQIEEFKKKADEISKLEKQAEFDRAYNRRKRHAEKVNHQERAENRRQD